MATPIPSNHASFCIDEIASSTQGVLLGPDEARASTCEGVSTDTRDVTPGALFVALKGERFDGHDYVAAAVERGARALIVHRDVDGQAIDRAVRSTGAAQPTIVRVEDTRVALGHLARAHRRRWAHAAHASGPRRLLAITGSAGKTTTKIVTSRLLNAAAPGQVHASAGNLNNDVGVPMTLFGLEPVHRFAVVEIGTSRRGEIELLARIAEPDAAILTLVASAHTEGLGTIEHVALEKGDLLASLPPSGIAMANGDDPRARAQLLRSPGTARFTYGFASDAAYRVTEFHPRGADGSEVVIQRPAGMLSMSLPLIGRSSALAAAAAVAATEALLGRPMTPDEAARGCAALADGGVEGRLRPVRLADGTLVLDDTYNANPASMRSSIDAAALLAQQEVRRLVLVLGEMRELGPNAVEEHQALGRYLETTPAAFVLGIGGDAERLVQVARALGIHAEFVPDVVEASSLVSEIVQAGDVVLVKGSRGVRTDRAVAHLVATRGSFGSSAGAETP